MLKTGINILNKQEGETTISSSFSVYSVSDKISDSTLSLNSFFSVSVRLSYYRQSLLSKELWDSNQIETLFDSLMRGYPISTFLFWEISKEHVTDYDFYAFINNYHENKGTHNKKVDLKGSDGVTAVLDGQQRLTSLYIGLKGTYAYKLKYLSRNNQNAYPIRKLYLNLLASPTDSDNEYDFQFLTDKEVENSQETFWFEVGSILDMKAEGDVFMFVNENISYSDKFDYSKEQSKFAINTLSS